ncbi:hypothetical protein GN244_ATG08586 [Phytophthora infestans]|uniref:Myb-like domain-containing protein n=1 Tax=Phytophthora infestans TaxID=4787 RepID=A0A833SUY3_PHYIN|nr:hypothetical protein GN244_ATG08586 [Phytophthora infestans]KAF4148590.1 hypothetical protein GN958_ATG02234 [Phytophthora infestans]KAI9984377.1 hypothetical protein PInf_005725 [Phytophthora infestans]KAI9984405.1 hypothetical protein PInf_005753 [Phytophthora infestans]KAI9994019.1 hypothetical protein PInf_016565 [Phytophthora infestans]
MAALFEDAKTKNKINEAWSLVASQLCVIRVKVFTTTQCRAKMRNMKTRWTATRRAATETGNRPVPRDPKHMNVITEYWGDLAGMGNVSLLSTDEPDITASQGLMQEDDGS